jgi:hypothetical protein
MSEAHTKNFLVFGLSGAGKSTFAAALWHLVDSREVPTVLAKGTHSGNFSYLEKIAQRWSDGWRLERTKSEEVENVRINLLHEESDAEFALEFKDIAGESLQAAFTTRYCDPDYVELVKNSDGMLLFVSANYKMDDVTILDVKIQLGGDDEELDDDNADDDDDDDAEKNGEEAQAGTPDDQAPNIGVPPEAKAFAEGKASTESKAVAEGQGPRPADPVFDPARTPVQVRLVDLLQSLRLDPFSKRPFRIAVVVSAWDLAQAKTADEWLAKRMPLLDQFLRGGEIADSIRVYGVSAQGGMYPKKGNKDDEERKRIMSIHPASKRISVVGHGAGEHDLTHPVRWLSGLETED